MNVSELYQVYLKHPVVSTDSRNCPPGALFFALKGDTFDGNRFAKNALDAGAAYAIIDDPSTHTDSRMILTPNALLALQQLAAHHRAALGTPIIGVTGTNGKTTTKELISSVLSASCCLLFTQGNLNNHIGTPLTLLRLTEKHEMAVVEMGANHPGEIAALTAIVKPNYGIITNIGYAHLEGFGSLDGVMRTKGELYDYLRRTKGKIFIHSENECLQAMAQGIEQITYGLDTDAFVSGKIRSIYPFLHLGWKQPDAKVYDLPTRLVGDYNVCNVLAAIAVGRYFGVSPDSINNSIAGYVPANNRSQWRTTTNNELIIDAYNANLSSMEAALKNFHALPVSPKAVILGDMLELGTESPAFHARIVDTLRQYDFRKVWLCGSHFAAVCGDFACFTDTQALKEYLKNHPIRHHHILIKGSHGVHLEQIIGML